MTDTAGVRVDRPCDGVAVVVLDRPERLNAIDEALFEALPAVFDELGGEADVRAVVLTGAGRGFCSGLDLQADPPPSELAAARTWMQGTHRGPRGLYELAQPAIAAVNGAAAGGGLGLALACDIRIAAPAASFSAPFVRMGLTPDFGVSGLLPRAIGTEAALELLLTGRKVDADEALRLGLISRVADDALEASVAVAERIASMPGDAPRRIKALVRASGAADHATVLSDLEPAAQAVGLSDPGFAERAGTWLAAKSDR